MKMNLIFFFLITNVKHTKTCFEDVGKTKIWDKKQKLVTGSLIDRDLKFEKLSQHKNADKKLIRANKFMTLAQRKNNMKAFIESQFARISRRRCSSKRCF